MVPAVVITVVVIAEVVEEEEVAMAVVGEDVVGLDDTSLDTFTPRITLDTLRLIEDRARDFPGSTFDCVSEGKERIHRYDQ